MAVSNPAHLIDKMAFWRQFNVAFYFDQPGDEVAGELLDTWAEGRGVDAVPALRLQTSDGRRFDITAHQERLKAELVRKTPVPGDWVTITYLREADKYAPGMSPAKLFRVEVVPTAHAAPTLVPDREAEVGEAVDQAAREWTAEEALAGVTASVRLLDLEPNHQDRAHFRKKLTLERLSWRSTDWSVEDVKRVATILRELDLWRP